MNITKKPQPPMFTMELTEKELKIMMATVVVEVLNECLSQGQFNINIDQRVDYGTSGYNDFKGVTYISEPRATLGCGYGFSL